jgi:CMP-N-acetylneuraminic acid synthetase
MRSKKLAQDSTSHVEVLKNAVKILKETENYEPDIICLVQPTSPLVKANHIDDSIKLILDTGADSVEGIFVVPKIFHPHNVRYIGEDGFTKFLFPKKHAEFKKGKNLPPIYAIGTVVTFRPKNLRETNTTQGRKSKALIIEPKTAIDIDEPIDVAIAEAIMKWTNFKKYGKH